ncbi:carboxypeptidase regulatory-like domain-containing protein [Roseiconus nitratireducens]|uniref:Carboxypeptidase regulatory-like domain-containing protein n=1 Tax=Roseiconus nitratireducens TaxID=2605748 RepID=A0A5M6D573_9BACT|nr:carboxypeptidase regulatory-like domain-containing protein [Roseiconus nitratireducens]
MKVDPGHSRWPLDRNEIDVRRPCAIYRWLLNSPERVSAINLSLMHHDFTSTTDEDGVAQFDWIPDWQTRMMTFWNSRQPGWTRRRVTVDPNAVPAGGGIHATLKIERLIPFSGRVMDQQGNPVPDATVTLAGEHGERHSSTPRTDAQGRYQIKVPPRMNFLITAVGHRPGRREPQN